jgi:hypothetical protein
MDEFSEREMQYANLCISGANKKCDMLAIFPGEEYKTHYTNEKLKKYIAEKIIEKLQQQESSNRLVKAKKLTQLDNFIALQSRAMKALLEIIEDPLHKDRATVARSIMAGHAKYLEKVGENLANNDLPVEEKIGEQIDALIFEDNNEH